MMSLVPRGSSGTSSSLELTLTFKVEPDFLTVRTPGVVVAVERHADVGLGLAEEAERGLRIGRAVFFVRFRDEERSEIVPSFGRGREGGGGGHVKRRASRLVGARSEGGEDGTDKT